MMIRVWDVVVRLTHWTVAALVLWEWIDDSGGQRHRTVGYVVAGVVVLRLLWGLIGTPPARFSTWLPTPAGVVRYTRALMAGRAPRHLSHTPPGALMMLSIWTVILALAVTGWISRLDPFWGEDWPIDLHALLSDILMAMVVIHVLAAVAMSVAHKDNLIAAMVTGKKRGAKPHHEPD